MVILNPWRLIAKEVMVFFGAVALFMATLLLSLQLLTPYLNRQLPNLNLWIAQKMPVPAKIDQVYITWVGLRPALRAENVQWLDDQKRPIIQINHLDFIINPIDSLINQKWHVKRVFVDEMMIPNRAEEVAPFWPMLNDSLTPLKVLQGWMIDQIDIERIRWGTYPLMSAHMSRDDDWIHWQMDGMGHWEGIVDFTPLTQGRSGQLYLSGDALPLSLLPWDNDLKGAHVGQVSLWANFHKSHWHAVDANIHIDEGPLLVAPKPLDIQLSGQWQSDRWVGQWLVKMPEQPVGQARWEASSSGWQMSVPTLDWPALQWQDTRVSGQWSNIHLEGDWRGWFSGQGDLRHGALTHQALQVSGIQSHCQADRSGGVCQLDTPTLSLTVDNQRWQFDQLSAPIRWQVDENKHWSVDSEQLSLDWAEQTWQGWLQLSGQADRLMQQTWQVSAPTVEIATLITALSETHLAPKLQSWLQQALSSGQLEEPAVRYHHWYDGQPKPVIDFPHFSIEGNIVNAPVQYAPQWPDTHIDQGRLKLDHGHLWIDIAHATTGDSIESPATVSALNIHQPEAILQVSTQPVGRLSEAAEWLMETPLKSGLGEALQQIQPHGPLKADLTFRFPLASPEDVALNGVVWLNSATFDGPKALPWLSATDVSGQLIVTEQQAHAENMTGQLFNYPATIHFDGQFDPHRDTSAQCRIGVEGHSDVAWWAEQGLAVPGLSGDFDFYSDVQLSWSEQGYPLWQIAAESNWADVKIDWPAPLNKPKDTPQLVSATLDWAWPDQIGVRVQFGEQVSLAQRLSYDESTQEWDFLGGHLVIDEAPFATFPEGRGWLMEGSFDNLNLSDWYQWYLNQSSGQSVPVKDDIQWDLTVGTLQWSDLTWPHVNLQGHVSASSHVYLKGTGPEMDVTATWLPKSPHLLSIEAAHFKLDHWPAPLSDTPIDWAAWQAGPHIQLHCDQCYFRNMVMNGLTLNLLNQKTGYHIQQAQALPSGDVAFNLNGNMTLTSPRQGELKGQAMFSDMGHAIRILGLPSALRDAPAHIEGHMAWQGDQWSEILSTASGHAQLKLKQGRILGVEPGIGRILSLLSLSNIRRRLTLDFSDLTRKGFSFDELSGRVDINRGTLRSPALMMKGPIADVLFSGQVGLIDPYAMNIEMTLSPHITKALPLAVLIASGNPAVGAGAWLLNKALGKNVGRQVSYRYAVTGEWDAPNIKELAIYQDVPASKPQ